MNKKKILFTIGSPNQTSQMHQISLQLPEFDNYFTQHYGKHPWVEFGQKKTKLLDNTIIGERSHWKKKADAYLEKHNLRNDYRAERYGNKYDMAVLCIDYLMPKMIRKIKTVFVQEGMIDPITNLGKVVKFFRMPGYWAFDTSLMGYSNKPDIYCVASEGYKEHYIKMGVHPGKIIVSGIPNFDNAAASLENDFPYRNYVMVATSDIRETFKKEDRIGFIKRCVKIADGRQLLFKLHPNEFKERAEQEIRENAPADALIFQDGNTDHMIANCEELVCQYSTVVYMGMALGKKVHSFFDMDYLQKTLPVQNGGTSASRIADVVKSYMDFPGNGIEFLKQYQADWLHENPHRHTSSQRLHAVA